MKSFLKVLIALVVIGMLALVGLFYMKNNPQAVREILAEVKIQPLGEDGELTASGFIEAEEVAVVAEVGGRIEEIYVDEGDRVHQGKVLIELDKALLQAQIRQAEAAVEVAKASLAQIEAGARPEEIRKAEASLAQAETARDWAYRVWQDAKAVLDNPQELEARIDAARAQVEAAKYKIEAATGSKDAAEEYMRSAERLVDFLEHPGSVSFSFVDPLGQVHRKKFEIKIDTGTKQNAYAGWNEASNQWWQGWIGVNTAVAKYEGAKRNLENLLAMREDPQSLKAQVDAAWAECKRAEALVEQARAALELLRAGARKEQVSVFETIVEQKRAALRTLEVQLEKMTLRAPRDGLVIERAAHRGEIAAPGANLLTIADLEKLTLTLYIPEDEIGLVKPGQEVEVRVDSYPERIFPGRVKYIAQEAEFTPKNVQTQKERVNMVFAVKVEIPNPDYALKPGMPADAVLKTK